MQDPHETHARLPRLQKRAADEQFLSALNAALVQADLPGPVMAIEAAAGLPIIYIVGAPRSGTTLLSQLLVRALPVGYIDNIVARFWRRPSVGIRLSRIVIADAARRTQEFSSEHGVTSGVAGPHEFGNFWRHWLALDASPTHHLSDVALAQLDADALQHELRAEVLAHFGMPAVFKNVICGFHAGWLSALHPPSLFIHITRDRRSTCASVLEARLERHGTYAAWWSLKPSTYAEIAQLEDPCQQVVRQVQDCTREMQAALAVPAVRQLELTYEEVCSDPPASIERVCRAVSAFSEPISPVAEVPLRFELSAGPRLPPDIERRLETALAASTVTK